MTTQRQAKGAIRAEKTITRKTKTTLSTPVSLVNKSNKITSKRTTPGTPGVLKQVGFKKMCSTVTMQVGKTEKVDLKSTKLR